MRGILGRVGVGGEEDVLVRGGGRSPGLIAKINDCRISGIERREREKEKKKRANP